MKVKDGMAVIFNCIIKNKEGVVLEDSKDGPASYIHGTGMALAAIEEALMGKEKGFAAQIVLDPEMAFGEYHEEMLFSVSIDEFDGQEIAVGMEFLPAEETEHIVWRVVSIDDENVELDGNHPYAGMTLVFDIEILEVREATPKELDHGHVHVDGDHAHD
ncbi:MAG: FKBP-type peptidyl-prolyl cis-trans isomerase [Spirochaetia bacterium]